METDLFPSCGHHWVFQICWHIECSTFTASSFRNWNSSTGIPSPPLALLAVTLPKAHFHFQHPIFMKQGFPVTATELGLWSRLDMFKLLYNCTPLTHYQSNAQNSPSEASTVCEPRKTTQLSLRISANVKNPSACSQPSQFVCLWTQPLYLLTGAQLPSSLKWQIEFTEQADYVTKGSKFSNPFCVTKMCCQPQLFF